MTINNIIYKIGIGIVPKNERRRFMTKQKTAILSIIRSSCKHMTAEEIFFEARKEVPSISLSTVYRNLTQLANEGLINKIDISESRCIFDKNVILHAHKVNDMTGEIEDVFSEELDTLVRSLVDKGIVSYNLVIHYK